MRTRPEVDWMGQRRYLNGSSDQYKRQAVKKGNKKHRYFIKAWFSVLMQIYFVGWCSHVMWNIHIHICAGNEYICHIYVIRYFFNMVLSIAYLVIFSIYISTLWYTKIILYSYYCNTVVTFLRICTKNKKNLLNTNS